MMCVRSMSSRVPESEGRACFRPLYGERKQTEPSPFLASIPPELIEFPEADDSLEGAEAFGSIGQEEGDFVLDYGDSQLDGPPLPLTPASDRRQTFRIGERLEHESLGIGIVRRVEGSGHKEKITVQFTVGGIKKLMVQVSPIKKLS